MTQTLRRVRHTLSYLLPLLSITLYCAHSAAESEDKIHLNQIGYLPNSSKLATITASSTRDFHVIDVKTGKSIFQARLGSLRLWDMSNSEVSIADFSAVTTPGKYQIKIPKTAISYSCLLYTSPSPRDRG